MGNGPQALKKGLESSVCVKGKNRLLRECPNHAHGTRTVTYTFYAGSKFWGVGYGASTPLKMCSDLKHLFSATVLLINFIVGEAEAW
jgi:hypothetical protein